MLRYEFEIENVGFISENDRLTMAKVKGRYFIGVSSKYKKLRKGLGDIFRVQGGVGKNMIEGRFDAFLTVYTYKDMTNVFKPIFDALQDAEIIKDDRNLRTLCTRKIATKRGGEESLHLVIEEI